MTLEMELGVSGKGKTRREAMEDAERNALELLRRGYPQYDLILYGTRNIFISSEPSVEVVRDVTFTKRKNTYRLKIG